MRLNTLFFAVFILFSILILRLGVVQIVEGEEFTKELEGTSNTTARIDAPRGLMYDRYGNVVVDNKVELSLTYTNPSNSTSAESMIQLASQIEKLIDIETDQITDRDKRDYILATMSIDERFELVSKEERSGLENNEQYQLEIERITDKTIDSLSEKDLRILAIYREMSGGYANSPQRIKRGITDAEAHVISENLDRLPGFDILRDSTRHYVYGDSFRSLFGSTGPVPREDVTHYLSRGYERSDYVGTSFLEQQYEDVLRGQKAIVESITQYRGSNSERSIQERPGQRGNDLVLTLDMELQQALEAAMEKELQAAGNSFITGPSAYAVLLEPKTGDVLSMAGFHRSNPDHIGNVNKAFEMGSSVKGASVLTGFEVGVAHPGKMFYDRVISLPGTPDKKSVRNYGWVDDQKALEVSSNVYMFEIAMLMAGCEYPNNCNWNSATVANAYDKARYYFSQFGLGTETGIDLPSTATGLTGGRSIPGNLLDLFIGQYDTYTPLQLAQYIATIANDGQRMAPRLVQEIREASTSGLKDSAVIQSIDPTVLNQVDMNESYIQRVQGGLRRVVTNGTARRFSNKSYQPAAKTGTAQVSVMVGEGDQRRSVSGNTQSIVGYAPYDNPEIAFAIIVPNVKLQQHGGRAGMAQNIAEEILDTYFKMKSERSGPAKGENPS